jgi:hypothetical protein
MELDVDDDLCLPGGVADARSVLAGGAAAEWLIRWAAGMVESPTCPTSGWDLLRVPRGARAA